jgi:hypothetical protein
MAAGKRAAEMIDKYLRGQPLAADYRLTRPGRYVPPLELNGEDSAAAARLVAVSLPAAERLNGFAEVSLGIPEPLAIIEARRCLRCDLETADAKRALEATTERSAERSAGNGR